VDDGYCISEYLGVFVKAKKKKKRTMQGCHGSGRNGEAVDTGAKWGFWHAKNGSYLLAIG
jgi:hypothetical protein